MRELSWLEAPQQTWAAWARLDDPRLFQKYGLTQATERRIQIMSGTIEQLEGGCLCGAVRFIATGQPKGIYWCHCQSCRRHTGAPVAVFAVFDCEAYRVTKGEITKFDSTPRRTRRGFCAVCGSTLTCETLPGPTETHFHVGAFDQAAELQPTKKQYFPEERLPWFHIAQK
jgi:hypothetical protein